MCSEWADDFAAFENWALANGYADGLSIDRIDNDAGYSPDNCRWADAITQAGNKRNVPRDESGEPYLHKARKNGISDAAYRSRVFAGWDHEKASTTPMMR